MFVKKNATYMQCLITLECHIVTESNGGQCYERVVKGVEERPTLLVTVKILFMKR